MQLAILRQSPLFSTPALHHTVQLILIHSLTRLQDTKKPWRMGIWLCQASSKCLTDSTLVKKAGTRRGSLDSKLQKSLHIGEAAAMSQPCASPAIQKLHSNDDSCLLHSACRWRSNEGASDQPRLIAMSALHVYGLLFGTRLCHIKGMTPHTRTLLVSLAVCVDCHVGTRSTTNSHLHGNAHFGGPHLHSTAARCIACHIEVSWQPANCLLLPRHVAPQDLLNSLAKNTGKSPYSRSMLCRVRLNTLPSWSCNV